jgi:subtilisin family serine protease
VAVLFLVLALPAVASARVWRPSAPAPERLAPLEPVGAGSPLLFPARAAPRIIVGVAPGADLDDVAVELRPYASSLRILRAVGEVSLVASNGAAVAALAARDSRIAFANPDRTLAAQADPFDAVDPATAIPYDWQYDAVQAGPALAAVGGGSSTIVAIIDSGVDIGHPDLVAHLLPGYDATGSDGTVTDEVGHGTFVTGLVAMLDGNGIGGKGIGGGTMVLPIRASLDTGFRETVTIAAVIWAADHGAGVINLSLGGSNDDPALDRAIDYAVSKNALVVAAAGNDGHTVANPVNYPAAYVGGAPGGGGGNGGWSIGVSVAATMPDNQVASFSSHNQYVTVAAPGAGASGCSFGVFSTLPTNVLSTEWDDSDPCNTVLYSTPDQIAANGRWGYGEGTSFSAPIVSAIAALVRQANPLLTPSQVADVLRRSATQTVGTGWNPYSGAGLVNAAAAVELAHVYDTTAPTVSFAVVPAVGGLQVDAVSADAVDPGKPPAGGLTVALDASSDGVHYAMSPPVAAAELHQLVPTAAPTWLRATVCDANHNCTQSVAGPLNALVPAPAPKPARLELRIVSREHAKLKVSLSLAGTGKGTVTVKIESWSGKKWHAFDRVKVRFGKTVTRIEHVTRKGRYKLRARLAATPTTLQATSRAITLRVR